MRGHARLLTFRRSRRWSSARSSGRSFVLPERIAGAELRTTPSLLGHTGELRDDSPFGAGLVYLRARWYDPRTGRFLTPDPLPGDVGRPASLNRFAYAEADPVGNTDPSGQCPMCWGAVKFVLWGSDASLTTENGVTTVTRAGGLEGLIVWMLGGGAPNTVTWSDSLIVTNTSELPSRVQRHELGHVSQAREYGLDYVPRYLRELVLAPGIQAGLKERGVEVGLHDAHPMERDADLRGGLPDPWRQIR